MRFVRAQEGRRPERVRPAGARGGRLQPAPAPARGADDRRRRRCIEAIRDRRIEIVGAVEGFDETGVLLAGGERIEPDAVIAATGYRTGLEPLVGHLGVLDAHGAPRVIRRRGRARPALRRLRPAPGQLRKGGEAQRGRARDRPVGGAGSAGAPASRTRGALSVFGPVLARPAARGRRGDRAADRDPARRCVRPVPAYARRCRWRCRRHQRTLKVAFAGCQAPITQRRVRRVRRTRTRRSAYGANGAGSRSAAPGGRRRARRRRAGPRRSRGRRSRRPT